MAPKTEIKPTHQTTYPAISPTRPELSTKGKNALISGGGSGLGAELARSMGKSGITNLAILGRTEATLLSNKAKIEALSPETTVWTYVVDVVDPVALAAVFKSYAESISGNIDILVANAGYMPDVCSIMDSDPEDWWKGFDISIRGNYNLLRAFQPYAAVNATVIHISTAAIHLPYMFGYSAYQASKMASYKMFEHYFHESPDFTVIQVHPGLIGGTDMTTKFASTVEELGLIYDDPVLPADFVVWLVSKEAEFLNGRFVWAAWDVEELKALEAEIKADPTLFTMQLSV